MEEAAAAVLQVLFQKLIEYSRDQVSLVRGFRNEAEQLTRTLGMIQAFLRDADMSSISGGAVMKWLTDLGDVGFDADDVLDEIIYHQLSEQSKADKMANKPMKRKVLSCFSFCLHISRARSMALRIQQINRNLRVINQRAADLGLVGRLAAAVPTLPDVARETDSFSVDPIFIGRDEIKSKIVEQLTACSTTDERISILAIVGMGGLGKTTLTREVYNFLKDENRFGSHIWVHVSRNLDPLILFNKILKGLTSPSQVEIGDKEGVLKELEVALKNKSYLLILDDIWNESVLKWEEFIHPLLRVSSMKGNVIVVTTRSMDVASIMNPLHKHELQILSNEDCWSIIKEKTFGKENVPLAFEASGTKIAEKCNGLPLAASVVGGVLLCDKSEEKWHSIKENWLSRYEGNDMAQILKFSFDNLSLPSLKKCFAYCSIFPKGYKFKTQTLIEYWMGEGFLEADDSSDMESMGEKFIHVLLRNSLLQIAERDVYGNVESCVMHDLLHDLAASVLGGSFKKGEITRVRYMFLKLDSRVVLKENERYLRTLLSMYHMNDCMFSNFKSLHVLAFESWHAEELSSEIKKLIHLRVLDIDESSVEYLPDWIGELFHLQTLRACNRKLKKLPSTLKNLRNLRHLYITKGVELFAKIGRLTSLRTLQFFRVGDNNGYKIEELGSLNCLKGKLEIDNLERVRNKEEAEKAKLSNKPKLLELYLGCQTGREGETTNDENVLEGLQPHSLLKQLEISGFGGRSFPSWARNMEVDNGLPFNKLVKITLSDCSECEEIPMFGQLPNLKCLRLYRLRNVKSINSSFYGAVNDETRTVFPVLEELMLDDLPKLTVLKGIESVDASAVSVFPHLQKLRIEDCRVLTSFPTHFWSSLKDLNFSRIGSYKPLADIFQTELTLLTELFIDGVDDVESLPDWLFYSIPNLSKLMIWKCSNLREIPDGLGTLNSLKVFRIGDCPNLKWIGDLGVQQSQESLRSLTSLGIWKCEALLYLPCEMLGSSLKDLGLRDLSSLENLPEIIACLLKSPCLSSLEWLSIDASVGGLMDIVNGCSSLYVLELEGMESWENLPESIQYLTTLSNLWLENFGMEELPEWLGNLSSLWELRIRNCKKLRRLPSLDAMRRLTELFSLSIEGCPEICVEEASDAADSQWPNISHIPDIFIDGRRIDRRRAEEQS
ncbi:putative disease resistance protein RGA3 [Salvia splendens]|uniref:putative disease resistance protein RGA3 n=1 Tax=Salvia splendens TaxID=180675 RepID=UPI001C25CBBE|nr:putative disease resistance protein RGA3 [Salvia splendens]XP_042030777.1 putative disease resistance protein RGA3 [Salvia splendens]XP_042030778.1 putative disease resistance protein RGA3 [Salvia splendens]XP_042030779.1 putative disease resistance protein RGA3 [Salvia splendens]XP_042030780.1 putative disease resistance protein RGA3 [Salvia splendens]